MQDLSQAWPCPTPNTQVTLISSKVCVCVSVAGTGTNIAEKTPARQWVGATYFAVMLLTTTGLGDTEPATPAEEILASIQMMMGVFVFGLIVSVSQ